MSSSIKQTPPLEPSTKSLKPNANRDGYKKTKLGWIPEEWEVYKLAETGKIITGSTPKTSESQNYGGSFLFVSPADINSNKYVNKTIKKITEVGFLKGRLVEKNSILFVCIGSTIGKIAIAGKDLITNQQINSITPDNNVDSDFLYYQLDIYAKKIKLMAGEQAVPLINKTDFSNIKIPLPPLPEQQKIAQILSTWDKAIALQEQLIAEKQALKKSLMQQLLTGKKRFPGFTEDWEEVRLEEVCDFKNGKGHEQNIDSEGGFVVVNSKFISSNGIVRKYTEKQISPLYSNDIVMVMSDVPNGRALAKCFLIEENEKFSLNQRICSLTAKNINTKFLYYQLNRNRYYLKFNDGLSQTNLKKKEVLSCPILLPSLREQEKIVAAIETSLKFVKHLKVELENMSIQKQGLMQQLLTGEKRVKI